MRPGGNGDTTGAVGSPADASLPRVTITSALPIQNAGRSSWTADLALQGVSPLLFTEGLRATVVRDTLLLGGRGSEYVIRRFGDAIHNQIRFGLRVEFIGRSIFSGAHEDSPDAARLRPADVVDQIVTNHHGS